ncbi:hypothetical protein JL722_4505 [Aureococcus anophagefferens]|nr:hypothetical protein JL722_4505 [Aureococcus anophagefferens]
MASAVLCERPRLARMARSSLRGFAARVRPQQRPKWELAGAREDANESPAAALYGAFGRGGFDGGGMCIRRARADDIPQIQVCNRASLPENYNDSFYARHLADWGHLAFVADADREVVGYVLGRVNERHTETPAGPGSTRPTEGHITSLAVSDRFRRRGVAKQLMVAVHDEMEKLVQTSKLHVRCSNAGALQLYASLGYAVVDVVQGYYHDGEAAYLMAADLEAARENARARGPRGRPPDRATATRTADAAGLAESSAAASASSARDRAARPAFERTWS